MWPRILIWTLVVLFAAGVATAGVFIYQLNSSFNQAEKIASQHTFPDEASRPEAVERPVDAKHDAQNILLLGSDIRGDISEDLALGGVPLAVQTVENIIETRIDHVAIIDFEGFKGLTDALGGVTVNNSTAFISGGHLFAAGDIKLDGDQALTFVRERYAFADGDYSRAANQQRFMKAVISEVLSKDTLTNPAKILDTVDAFSPFLTVDEGLNPTYMVKLGSSMPNIRPSDITFFTSPTNGTGMEGKQSVVYPNWEELGKIATLFRTDSVTEYVSN